MSIHRRNELFRPYQLLPPTYNHQRRVSKAICAWFALACTLLAVLGGLTGAMALEAERDYQARQQLAAAAAPLLDLRRDILHLSQSNRQRSQWCDGVESARPDGDAFETLAAIATTSQSDGSNIRVDHILIKMPLEYAETNETVPQWAVPQLGIRARVSSPGLANEWVRRLNHSDRVTAAEISAAPLDLSSGRVEITATPITTRVLP